MEEIMKKKLTVLFILIVASCQEWTKFCSSILSNDNNSIRSTKKQPIRFEHEPNLLKMTNVYSQYKINASDIIIQQYVDEYNDELGIVLNRDDSIDERLANIIHSIYSNGVMNIDYFSFNSGDQQEDERNERRVEGGGGGGGDKSSGVVDDVKCGQHLNEMVRQLDELANLLAKKRHHNDEYRLKVDERHIRLARALDSFGHYDSGFMSGKTHSFGSYEQCLNTPLNLEPKKLTQSRFCWAKLKVDKHLDESLAKMKRKYPLTVGICLPETCHTRSLKLYKNLVQKLIDSQFKLPESMFAQVNLEVDSIFCTVDSNSRMGIPTSGKILLMLMVAWVTLALFATINRRQIRLMEENNGSNLLKSLLISLDLKRSWLEFVGVNHQASSSKQQLATRRRVDLDTLNPIRWAGCAFVIYGHALLVRIGHSMDQFKMPSRMEGELFGGFVLAGTVVVDTFFAMTGLLMAYLVMKKANNNNNNNNNNNKKHFREKATDDNDTQKRRPAASLREFIAAIYRIIKTRYLRLFPMLIVFYWFKRSVFIYLGSGPLWDFGFNRETYIGACHQESWLVPFTFTSAFKPLSKQCLMQSWSVSNDMFFVLIFAPILLIMTRKPKLAVGLTILLCAASLKALLDAISALNAWDSFIVTDLTAVGSGYLFGRLSHIYSYPIYRINSFAIGMLAGYVLYHYEQKKQDKLEGAGWPRWFKGPATKLSLIYIGSLFLIISNSGIIKHYLKPHHRLIFPYFMTLGKTMWATSNCIVFLRMITDWNGSFWMRASASKFWQSISKLNYAMLLLHFDLLLYDATAVAQGNLNSFWTIFQAFATVYVICVPLSLVVHVVYENPMDKLMRKFTSETINEKKNEPTKVEIKQTS